MKKSIFTAALILLFLPIFGFAATLSLSPSSGTYSVGNIFTVNLNLNTGGVGVDGADVSYLNYDPSLLEVQGANITAGTLMPTTLVNTVDPVGGHIRFSQVASGGSSFSGSGVLAQVTFKAKSSGTANVNFDFTSGSTLNTVVASGGQNILTSVVNGSYTISGGGWGGNPPTATITASPTSITSGQSSTLTWSSTNTTSCTASGAWNGTLSTSGSQSVSPSSTATYTITCSGPGGSVFQNTTVAVSIPQSNPPTITFSSSGSTIISGQSATLTWSTNGATSCVASGAWSGTVATSGSQTVSPTSNSTYTLTCSGSGGSSSQSRTITVAPQPTITSSPVLTPSISLSADKTTISSGGAANITWSTTNAASCNGSVGWSGSLPLSGSQSVSPSASTNYTLSCTSATGNTAADTITITAANSSQSVPTVTLTAYPNSIKPGDLVTLTWISSNANACSAVGGWSGALPTYGTKTVTPLTTTSYTLNCTGPGGVGANNVTVNVEGSTASPIPSTNRYTFTRYLRIGSTGSEVSALQRVLQQLGFFPTGKATTNYFGPLTFKAVRSYQQAHGIAAVGSVGPRTRAALNSTAFVGSTGTTTSSTGKYIFYRQLIFGSTDRDVTQLQVILKRLGYYPASARVSGYFGVVTETAVRKFQRANGLESTGKLDAKTRIALYLAQ